MPGGWFEDMSKERFPAGHFRHNDQPWIWGFVSDFVEAAHVLDGLIGSLPYKIMKKIYIYMNIYLFIHSHTHIYIYTSPPPGRTRIMVATESFHVRHV